MHLEALKGKRKSRQWSGAALRGKRSSDGLSTERYPFLSICSLRGLGNP